MSVVNSKPYQKGCSSKTRITGAEVAGSTLDNIVLSRVAKSYRASSKALEPLSLEIPKGEFLFIAGASGAGKSTLLRLLFGGERPSSGTISVFGTHVNTLTYDLLQEYRRSVGFVFQDFRLLPRQRIIDNVAFPLEIRGVDLAEREQRALKILQAVGLEDKADAYPPELSGGEKQRASIARALIAEPKLLIADEPTGNLDNQMARVVFDLLLEANALGVTVIAATHNLSIIEEFNLRTIVLEKGRLVGDFDRRRRAVS